MKISYLAIIPFCSLAIACGGSTPESETPESVGGMEEAAPAEETMPEEMPVDEPTEEAPIDEPVEEGAAEEGAGDETEAVE